MMDMLLWVLACGFAGWIGFKFIGANAQRGVMVSIVIGGFGGFLGGNLLAPLLGETAPMADAFNPVALLVAVACAAACLTISDMIWRRFAI